MLHNSCSQWFLYLNGCIETVLDALAVIRTVPLAANGNIFEVTESEPLHAADTNGISLLDARHLILLTVTFLCGRVQQPT